MNVYRVRRRPDSWADHLRRAKYKWLQPFFALEWVWDWLSYLLGNWAFLEVLEPLLESEAQPGCAPLPDELTPLPAG